MDQTKLAKLSALIEDLLDEIEELPEGDEQADALFEPLSVLGAAVHQVLATREAARG